MKTIFMPEYFHRESQQTEKTILVAVDLSHTDIVLLDYAVSLAHSISARLVLAHVHEPEFFEVYTHFRKPEIVNQCKTNILKQLSILQEKIIQKNELVELPEIKLVAGHGFVADQIVKFAEEYNADFIIMGAISKHSQTKTMGSNTISVIENARCPIFVIPENAKSHIVHSIVYASDFMEDESRLIEEFLQFASVFNAEAKVLHIESDKEEMDEKKDENRLKNIFRNKPVSFHTIRQRSVAEGLKKYLAEMKPDIFVMTRRMRSFYENLFTDHLVNHLALTSPMPLLVLHKSSSTV